MPTPSVAPAVTRAMTLSQYSSDRGTKSITSTPASGKKVPTLNSQFWSVMVSMVCVAPTR